MLLEQLWCVCGHSEYLCSGPWLSPPRGGGENRGVEPVSVQRGEGRRGNQTECNRGWLLRELAALLLGVVVVMSIIGTS